ncbi:hypothetical protein OROGR_011068 [Orobanche gracilis]
MGNFRFIRSNTVVLILLVPSNSVDFLAFLPANVLQSKIYW